MVKLKEILLSEELAEGKSVSVVCSDSCRIFSCDPLPCGYQCTIEMPGPDDADMSIVVIMEHAAGRELVPLINLYHSILNQFQLCGMNYNTEFEWLN